MTPVAAARPAAPVASPGVIGRMITAGELPVGTRLPTVRELATHLGCRRRPSARRGTRSPPSARSRPVAATAHTSARRPGPGGTRRYRRITEGPGALPARPVDRDARPGPVARPRAGGVEGRQAVADVELPRPPGAAGAGGRVAGHVAFQPEAVTVVDGAMDALDRVAQVVLRLGDRRRGDRAPRGFPPMLDLLDQMGCVVVGVDVDDDGPTEAGLRAAIAEGDVRAVMLQPRAQNPAGSRLTSRRAKALADVLAGSEAIIVEDDHANDISADRARQPRHMAAGRTVHVRSYSKSHGPDLRLAAVGGAGDVVTAVAIRRLLGRGWSAASAGAAARAAEGPRHTHGDGAGPGGVRPAARARVRGASAGGIGVSGVDGINLWVRVADQRSVAVALAAPTTTTSGSRRPADRPDDTSARSPPTWPTPPVAPASARPTTARTVRWRFGHVVITPVGPGT